jgi:hypothetical protein
VDFRPLIEEVVGVPDDVKRFKVDTGCVLGVAMVRGVAGVVGVVGIVAFGVVE